IVRRWSCGEAADSVSRAAGESCGSSSIAGGAPFAKVARCIGSDRRPGNYGALTEIYEMCRGRPRGIATRRGRMFYVGDLFQWDRFITPAIIRTFYWLVLVVSVLFGLAGMISALGTMAVNPITGLLMLIASFAGMLAGIVFARIAAELVLIAFRINEHLGALRDRGRM